MKIMPKTGVNFWPQVPFKEGNPDQDYNHRTTKFLNLVNNHAQLSDSSLLLLS